jgi:prophage regulatory protein
MSRLIRLPEVVRLTGVSASTIRRLEVAGQFARRRRLSPNAVGWDLDEVTAWLSSRPVVTQAPRPANTGHER